MFLYTILFRCNKLLSSFLNFFSLIICFHSILLKWFIAIFTAATFIHIVRDDVLRSNSHYYKLGKKLVRIYLYVRDTSCIFFNYHAFTASRN